MMQKFNYTNLLKLSLRSKPNISKSESKNEKRTANSLIRKSTFFKLKIKLKKQIKY